MNVRTVVENHRDCIHNVNNAFSDVTNEVATCFKVILSTRSDTLLGMHDYFHQSYSRDFHILEHFLLGLVRIVLSSLFLNSLLLLLFFFAELSCVDLFSDVVLQLESSLSRVSLHNIMIFINY